MAGLPDHDALGLAPCEFEDLGRDQIVIEDHLGRLQSSHGFEGQELRIARPGSNQRHATLCRNSANEARRFFKQALAQRELRLSFGPGEGMFAETLPESAPAGEIKP